jgi:mRNA interferase RelE/StbE
VAKDLRRIPNRDVRRIIETINALSDNPRGPGCEKLSGQERYRARQGDYRIVYEIHDDEVAIVVVTVAHRREVYRA